MRPWPFTFRFEGQIVHWLEPPSKNSVLAKELDGCHILAMFTMLICQNARNVTFPHEAIRGINFSSAQVDAFPHHEWPEATSDREMHP